MKSAASIVDVRAVSNVSRDRLEYTDSSGNPCAIDLPACAERFARTHSPAQPSRCVGERHIDGSDDHLLLYADPPVRIAGARAHFLPDLFGWRRRKEVALLHDICRRISAAGWRLMDMT